MQTEDSGLKNPKIITLLYEGGTILYSKKSSYEEFECDEGLEAVVKNLMETQHREVVDRLKAGQLDQNLGLGGPPATQATKGGNDGVRFGAELISDLPLDELILAHLA